MRRRAAVQGGGRSAVADEWYGTSWECECGYSNVGTDRCYFCGSRAPRGVHPHVAAAPAAPPSEEPAAAGN